MKAWVELMYATVCCHRSRLRSMKWWWNLFSNLLNLSVVASFRFYNFVNQTNVTHLKFCREIATSLVRSEKARLCLGGPSAQSTPSVRFDGVNHISECNKSGKMCSLPKEHTTHLPKVQKVSTQGLQQTLSQAMTMNHEFSKTKYIMTS